jgi:putative ABC transport system substrate-binding protein
MRRRNFLSLVGGAAAWPLAGHAQQLPMSVVGYLSPGSPDTDAGRVKAVQRGLNELGYIVGQNVAMEHRWAHGQLDRLPSLAADLVSRRVAAIVTIATPAALAAKAATTTIPIVSATGIDPVQIGLITSLNRPRGNITGIYNLNTTVFGKRLELLHEVVPAAGVIALLANSNSSVVTEIETKVLYEAARDLGVELRVLNVAGASEIDNAFASLAKDRVPLVVSSDVMFTNMLVRLVELTAHHVIPAIYSYRDFPAAGGLMSYGPDLVDIYRQVGIYTGRILKGAKPADLPVQQAVKVELVINLKTAKALGITFPLPLLGRADDVIE